MDSPYASPPKIPVEAPKQPAAGPYVLVAYAAGAIWFLNFLAGGVLRMWIENYRSGFSSGIKTLGLVGTTTASACMLIALLWCYLYDYARGQTPGFER